MNSEIKVYRGIRYKVGFNSSGNQVGYFYPNDLEMKYEDIRKCIGGPESGIGKPGSLYISFDDSPEEYEKVKKMYSGNVPEYVKPPTKDYMLGFDINKNFVCNCQARVNYANDLHQMMMELLSSGTTCEQDCKSRDLTIMEKDVKTAIDKLLQEKANVGC